MRTLIAALIALICLSIPDITNAQAQRSREFNDKYKLKEAVVLSRHNIRSPLSDSKSDLGRMTPHQWTKWSAGKSELTSRRRPGNDDGAVFPQMAGGRRDVSRKLCAHGR